MAKKKATYVTIEKFEDTDHKIYEVKEVYPNPVNKKVSAERLKELSTKGNKYGRPFIKEDNNAKN